MKLPRIKRKTRKKKLLIEVGIIVLLIFTVMTLVTGFLLYRGSKKLYLEAKNDMIDRDLLRIRKDNMNLMALDWVLDYAEEHPDAIKKPITDEDEQLFSKAIEPTNGSDMPKNLTAEDCRKLPARTQEAIAKEIFGNFVLSLSFDKMAFEYESLYCIDINEPHCGFVFYDAERDEYSSVNSLGETLEYRIEDHPAAQLMTEGTYGVDFNNTVYEEYRKGSDYLYVGYTPLVYDGKVRAVICITYDWSQFQGNLRSYLRWTTLIGVVILGLTALLLLWFLHRASIKPLKKIQMGVRRYMDDKDSEAIIKEMSKITLKNEFGVLSEDIALLAQEIDRFNEENVRLVSEQERVSTELALASSIQNSMLSKKFPDRPEFDLYASMNPAKEVGGDFYDFFMIDDDHLALVIADVSGKGVPAALFMMISMILVRNYARSGASPSKVIEKLNNTICDNNKDMMFVTVWFGIVELSTGHVTSCNAGHEYPLIRKSNGDFEVFKDKHGFVVGGIPGKSYKEYEFDIEKGGTLFLYTDGAPEATDAATEQFGIDRMLQSLNQSPDNKPQQLIEEMHKSIDAFVGDAPQFDDLTMLCIKYNGADATEKDPEKTTE